ncbi:olfactory receptor 151-like [Tachyglossus aculeatus]|uniref:olfactory receptor 151-like n=1 Tax=Tachyglossus aculeatus TaxID=9261 RepID=UPI0018F2CA49|nr:olfactory receptor 151-like [Tachyglossus aculeatus]
MAAGNHSPVTEFILAGLTERPDLQLPLFFLFLGIFVVTAAGNLGLITLIRLSTLLHTPMYFFLTNLSFIDLCYSSVITPKMLAGFVEGTNFISYPACMSQLYFFLIFVIAEGFMLAVMAYDRYVAICHPLLYCTIMSPRSCSVLVAGVYSTGSLCAAVHTACMLRLSFCRKNIINHYFCDISPLLTLSCSRTDINELVVFASGGFNMVATSVGILSSYVRILTCVLHIGSGRGRAKALGTCSSHIMAVVLFFGSGGFTYLKPSSGESPGEGRVCSLFYTTAVPMLNPLIYSLRNQNVRDALRKILRRNVFSGLDRY